MNFHHMNKVFLEDNFPILFIDYIIKEFVGSKFFPLMDEFYGYNDIQIRPKDYHKITFICPWGTFTCNKMFFGLKHVGDTFQRAISFTFHDLNHIVEAYLDELTAFSWKKGDHPMHLRIIFESFHYYFIPLNKNKYIFFIVSRFLLGFIVSKKGIMVDPLKVEAIVHFPPPRNIFQLQSLQGKVNFLQCFITNYVDITKGFICLMKKWSPLICNEFVKRSFNALMNKLMFDPFLSLLDYGRYFLLYIAVVESIVSMVLVQEDDMTQEHAIYYLSHCMIGFEINYSHIKKLSLEGVHTI
jgi:hypothetical protein